jgi:hypothetical protein
MGWGAAAFAMALLLLLLFYLLRRGPASTATRTGGECGSAHEVRRSCEETFKQRVAYPRRIEPSRPVTVVIRHRCGSHAEQTRKWV